MIRATSNADEYADKMAARRSAMPDAMDKLARKSVVYVQSEIPSYPWYDSAYRRTGQTGRTVTAFPGVSPARSLGGDGSSTEAAQPLTRVRMLGSDKVEALIGGRLSYIGYVIDEKEQARHMGHWWTLQQVVRDAMAGVQKIFRAGITELFGE